MPSTGSPWSFKRFFNDGSPRPSCVHRLMKTLGPSGSTLVFTVKPGSGVTMMPFGCTAWIPSCANTPLPPGKFTAIVGVDTTDERICRMASAKPVKLLPSMASAPPSGKSPNACRFFRYASGSFSRCTSSSSKNWRTDCCCSSVKAGGTAPPPPPPLPGGGSSPAALATDTPPARCCAPMMLKMSMECEREGKKEIEKK